MRVKKPKPKSLKIRNVPREQAKEEIKCYFEEHRGEKIFPSDIMKDLALDYGLIVEICDELVRKGEISPG